MGDPFKENKSFCQMTRHNCLVSLDGWTTRVVLTVERNTLERWVVLGSGAVTKRWQAIALQKLWANSNAHLPTEGLEA